MTVYSCFKKELHTVFVCGMRGLDASLYAETMMELEPNAKKAILKHTFWNNSSFGEYVLEQEAEKIAPFFYSFYISGDK